MKKKELKLKSYAVTYNKFDFFAQDFISCVEYVRSDNIYYDIGKAVCTRFEPMNSVRIYELPIFWSVFCLESILLDKGYKEIGKNLWAKYEK